MSKKKGFRTALATILVVLVIFAALTFAAIKYFLPMYQVSQSEVYSWAVKIYPLLIGITLIVIASMLGKSDKEDEGEEDKLPPNSYDAQLFEEPKDDPATKPKKNAPTVVPKVEEPETISDEAYAELISIFSTDEQEPEDEIKPFVAPEAEQLPEVKEEPVVEPLEEVEVQPEVEEPEEETEPEVESEPEAEVESESEPEPEAEPEAEATEEPVEDVQPETEPEEVEEEQPESETELEPELEEEPAPVEEPAEALAVTSEAPTSVEDPNKALVSAINALVEKMDDFTTAMIYGSEDDEEDEEEEYDEYEPEEEEPEETEEAVEEVEEEAPENDYEEHFSRIEQQISSLSDIVAKLADTLKNLPTPVAVAEPEPVKEPEPAPVEEVEPETLEPEPEPAPEPVETEAEAEPEPVDTTGSQIYKEYEGSPAKQTAMAEFDSAKDFGYDLTIAKVSAEQSAVALQLDDVQCIANGDNTLVIIPFADNAEAKEVLDKLGVPYEVKTMEAGSNMNFEDFAKDWIN